MFGDEGGTRHPVRLDGRRCTMHCTPRRIAITDSGDVLHDIEPGSVTSYFREESRITIAYSKEGSGESGGSVTVRADSPAEALHGISSAVSAFRCGREGPR